MEPQTTDLDPRFSDPAATALPWQQARTVLEEAGTYWLSTVRADGRPHVTPLIAVLADGAPHFCTGPDEQKHHNLTGNPACVLTTGNNELRSGLDVVVEGRAEVVRDDEVLTRLAEAWVAKYGEEWRFAVRDGAFHHDGGGSADVFRLTPDKAFAHAKDVYGMTRYRFG